MRFQYRSKFLDHEGRVIDACPIDKSVCICFGEFTTRRLNRSERRNQQSLAARQLLNHSLRALFGQKSASLWQLEKMHSGKPFLAGKNSPSISISHSDNWVACAIGNVSNIGIDIEAIKPRNWVACGEDIFHQDEASWVLRSDTENEESNIRGLSCWCRKEALVKALGTGMTVSPSSIAFSPEGMLFELPSTLGSVSGWNTHTHTLSDKVIMAVVWKN